MQTVEHRIEAASERDIPGIIDVNVAAYVQYKHDMPAEVFDAYIQDLEALAEHWSESEILIARFEGRVVGSVMFFPDASVEGLGLPNTWAGFRKLAVHPSMRGSGLGRSLVARCIGAARGAGAQAIGIHTTAFMTAACTMYENMGFRRCPAHDMTAAQGLGGDARDDDFKIIAYRFDLALP